MIDIQKRPVIKVSQACYDEIRKQLLALGNGANFESRGDRRLIDMSPGQVVIETSIDNKSATDLLRDEIRNDPSINPDILDAMEHFWKKSDEYKDKE